jgi:PAS domain S-box-containing protein
VHVSSESKPLRAALAVIRRQSHPTGRLFPAMLGYLAAYVALDWVSYIHPVGGFAITPWNPPPGLSLAVLLVFGLRMAPVVMVAGLVAEVAVRGWPSSFVPAALAVVIIAISYSAAAARLRTTAQIDPSVAGLRDVTRFLAIVVASTMLAAGGYVCVYVLAGQILPEKLLRSLVQFWVGDAVGILVTTPVLVYLLSGHAARPAAGQARMLLFEGMAIAAALWTVFGVDAASASKFFYVLFLPLLWISLRRGATGAAFALLAIQLGIIAAVQLEGYASATVLEFQLLTLALTVTGLFLGALVSDRRRTQEAVEAREAELRLVFDTAPDGILVLDGAGRIVRANKAASALFATPASGLAGLPITQLCPGLALGAAAFVLAEHVAVTPGGATFPAGISIGRTNGQPVLYIIVMRDLSAHKQMESQLHERELDLARALRLAAAAETAGALAHELNQPLSAIASYVRACTLLLDRPDPDHARVAATMRSVVTEVQRSGAIVRGLRNYFQSGASHLQRTSVADLVQSGTAPGAERLARHRIELRIDVELGLPEVLVDRVQIDMVLHNLIANAIEAIESADAPVRRIEVSARDAGNAVRICVSDTGPGLPPDLATSPFRPFTTTKPQGMGLGLAICSSIVESHGGHLRSEHAQRGAVLAFTLPAAVSADEAAS